MYKNCPNCGEKIVKEMFESNVIQSQEITDEINNYFENKNSKAYCSSCSKELLETKKSEIGKVQKKKLDLANKIIPNMPIITTHTPYNWEYKTCGIVTGIANMGTGLLSDLNSSVSDILGKQSSSYNNKMILSEKKCYRQLKVKALELNANAVIGVDIDYNEIGGKKQIQMVAMAGTAVKVTNIWKVMGNNFDFKEYNNNCSKYFKLNKKISY